MKKTGKKFDATVHRILLYKYFIGEHLCLPKTKKNERTHFVAQQFNVLKNVFVRLFFCVCM